MRLKQDIIQTDVLVVGGGIAGLMAAIAVADQGAIVTIAEKSDVSRSGDGVAGNDHFLCYIPQLHGSKEAFDREWAISGMGALVDKENWEVFRNRSFECALDWEKWGIDMRPSGEYECIGHAYPDRMRIWLKYDGRNQKKILRNEALKRGVRIVNKTVISEFLTDDGRVVGALGIDISKKEPETVLFRTQAIITCCGLANRLYPSITAQMPFNTCHCPANAGGGRAAAFRAGAELVNMEMPLTWVGPKYLERCGKASWIGLLSDPHGTPAGPFIKKPDKLLGDITADIWRSVFNDKLRDGSGPVYMNCTDIDQKDMDYMMWAFQCEGIESLVDLMNKQGFDLREKMVEFVKYEPQCAGGLKINAKCETNVPGLYGAGDESGNGPQGISGAAVTGRIAGENAAGYVREAADNNLDLTKLSKVQDTLAFYSSVLDRTAGAPWQELLRGAQQIMHDYAGIDIPRYEALLQNGYNYLCELDTMAHNELSCATSHELMRALEALDLLELGKVICAAALERKESRGMHRRIDCNYTNPLLHGKYLVVTQENDAITFKWQYQN